jgi:predicted nucleic acid-binding protein
MRFWDSSAIVPLLVTQASSPAITREYEADPEVIAWWATVVECVSAVSRLERDGALSPSQFVDVLRRLDRVEFGWQEVQPGESVRQTALRVLRVHALRAGDALQLAAAIVASEGHPATLAFVTLDDRLALAAEREGFAVVRPGPASA